MKTATYSTLTLMIITAAAGLGCGANAPAPTPDNTIPAAPVAAKTTPLKTRALPTATLPDGLVVKLDLAISQEEVAQGLMFRASLAEDRGMLFLFEQDRFPSFWMKNTLIPLDIIFLDAHGIVVDIAHDAQPCKAEPCPQYVAKSISTAVLEMVAGSARKHNLVEGARISFNKVPGYPRKRGD